MKFTVVDFETANNKRSSACAVGIVVVENGNIIKRDSWLIKPKDMHFLDINISIHGIKPIDVKNELKFDELYEKKLKVYFENQLVVAHNASFDMSVLRACLSEYNIKFPTLDYLCTVNLAKKIWPELLNYKLNTISKHLNFDFKHHDAYDDARACANIVIESIKKYNISNLYELSDKLDVKLGKIYLNGYKPCSIRK